VQGEPAWNQVAVEPVDGVEIGGLGGLDVSIPITRRTQVGEGEQIAAFHESTADLGFLRRDPTT